MATLVVVSNERFAGLLRTALQQKAAAEDGYSLRDLYRASGVDYSYASKLAAGTRRPSRVTVLALVRALAPYLVADEALLAAGHAPASAVEIAALNQEDARWFAGLPAPLRRQVRRIVQALQESMAEELPADEQPNRGGAEPAQGERREQGA